VILVFPLEKGICPVEGAADRFTLESILKSYLRIKVWALLLVDKWWR